MTTCMTSVKPKSINKPEKTHVLDGSAIFTALVKNLIIIIIIIYSYIINNYSALLFQ